MLPLRVSLLATLLSCAVPVVGVLSVAGDARASVSIAATYEGLLAESSGAAIVTPGEQRAVWENGRIYTYTRVSIDRVIAGALKAGEDAWVRTMGGIVGKIGQSVDGEAVLTTGRPSLLFLHAGPVGTFEVTARAQGQFPVILNDRKETRLRKSNAVGALVMPRPVARTGTIPLASSGLPPPPPVLAAEVIHDRLLEDVARDVGAAWKRYHAR